MVYSSLFNASETERDAVKKTSGFEALIDALKQSGVDVEGGFGKDGGSSNGAGGGGSRPPHVNIEMPFSDRLSSWGKKALIIAAIIIVLIGLGAYWWFHPPINIHSSDTWMFVGVFILLPLFLIFCSRSRSYQNGGGRLERNVKKAKVFKWVSLIPVLIVLIGIAGGVASLAIFPGNAEKYATIMKPDPLDFASDIKEVNYSQIPVIDHDSAVLLGNRAMGSIPEFVSQFEISPLYSQINYHGAPVRVSPLGYADLFKWFTNRDKGIPGYALVNMTTQDAQIVKLGDRAIFYSQSEPLGRNIDRYVQLKYPFYMFDEKSFEIDEDGNPWWIAPVQKRTIGLFGGTTISRVVMVNAHTGETQDLPIDKVPEWVDRAYPANLLIQQYNWSGKYKDGWLNSIFGQRDVVQTTPGTDGNLGYNYIAKDDDVWVYTGVTSATADKSIIGFILVNQRTAEAHFYSVAGATEESAMQSAEGQVQNLRYKATFPLLINVSGQPTYFMALKDNAGLVKQFAMLDIQHYQTVAVGNTVAETQKTYQTLLATSGALSGNSEAPGILQKQGTINTIAQAVIDGNSHFYVTLTGDKSIYDFALPAMIQIVGYKPGDSISFSYVDSSPTKPVQEFMGESADTAGTTPAAPAQGDSSPPSGSKNAAAST